MLLNARTLAMVVAGVFALPAPASADPVNGAVKRAMQRDRGSGGAAPIPAAPAPSPAPPSDANADAAWYGDVLAMDLPTALQAAMEQLPALAQARLDREVAAANALSASGISDWRLDAGLTVRSAASNVVGIAISRQTTIGASVDLSRSLSTGGVFSVHGESGFNKIESDTDALDGTEWTDAISVSLAQPLLAGRGAAIARAQVRQAGLARTAAELQYRIDAIEAVRSVAVAYWNLVAAEQALAIRRTNVALAEERLRLTRAGIAGGKVAPSEAFAVEQVVTTRREEVLAQELVIVDRSIALARSAGMTIDPNRLVLRTGADVTTPEAPGDLAELVAATYAHSPELAQLANRDASARIDVEVADNGLLPQLDAVLAVGPSGSADRPSEALTNMVKFDDFAISGSLTFSHDLGNRAARGQVKVAQVARQVISVSKADIEASLASAMARAVANIRVARQRVDLADQAIELAKKNITVEQSRFDLGKSTSFDVLQRQDEKQQAELRRTQAQIDARIAELTVLGLTGEILERYGVRVEPSAGR